MAMNDKLRKLGIVRSGATAGTYKNAKERPIEFQMDDIYNAEKDLISGDPNKSDGDPSKKDPTAPKINTLSIIGLVFAFFIPLVGLVCSIIGLKQINKRKEKGKGLAIAGIVTSVVVGLLQLLTLILIVVAINSNTVTLTTYRDSSLGYTVKYPQGWVINPQTADGAKGVVIKDEYKQTGKVFGQVEVVYIAPPANGYSKDVLQAISEGLQKDNQGTVVTYENRGQKNGLDTLTIATSYNGENGKVKAKTTIILKKDNSVYEVSTQAPEANWSKYQDSFDEIHNTFSPS